MSISPTSISPIVDAKYRIQPADLEGVARQVVIANVTYQGVEEIAPVLHFVGQTRRLVLSPDQVEQMINIARTAHFPLWIGISIILQPHKTKNESVILLKAVNSKQHAQPMPQYSSEDYRGWTLALLIVGVLLATSILFALLNVSTILTVLQQLRDTWPLR